MKEFIELKTKASKGVLIRISEICSIEEATPGISSIIRLKNGTEYEVEKVFWYMVSIFRGEEE